MRVQMARMGTPMLLSPPGHRPALPDPHAPIHPATQVRAANRSTVVKRDEGCARISERGHRAHGRKTDSDAATRPPQSLLPGLGRSFCTHAIGVDRVAARWLLRLAFPVTAVFDDLIFALDGGYGAGGQRATLERASLSSLPTGAPRRRGAIPPLTAEALRAVHLSESLFAQRSKDPRSGVESLTRWRVGPNGAAPAGAKS